MLFFVEMGIEFTSTYGDINEPFYRSLEGMYSRALQFMFDNDLAPHFSDRCQSIISNPPKIGWWFNENMAEIHRQYFDE